MNVTRSTELARMQMLQRQALEVRNALDRSAKELTTGLKEDRFEATGGNLSRLFALERSIARNDLFRETIHFTELRLDVTQEAIGRILAPAEALSIDLATAVGTGDLATGQLHAEAAKQAFIGAVATLNTQVSGQSLFAGAATDRPALAGAAAILADIDALVAGAPDAATALADIDAYFAKPGGDFHLNRFLGSPIGLAAAEIGEGVRLDYAVRADDDALVATLKGLAVAATVANGGFAAAPAEQLAMLGAAGAQLLDAKERVLDLRATVGLAQNRLETAQAERVSERDVLDLSRARIVAADPLDATAAFQAMQIQLENIFMVTARVANLRFANYMR
jgi:flagellar hook-associated protein 3 FlgL